IAKEGGMTLAESVAAIDRNRQHSNLSAAIRLFVLGFYRDQLRKALRQSSAAVATSREGHPSPACTPGTPHHPSFRLFQGAQRRYCRSLRQLLKCERTLQSFSDWLRPQTNIHSSARSAAARTRGRLPNQPQSH